MLRPALALWVVLAPIRATPPQIGQPAPAFSALDTQGRPVSLAALKGQVVVLEWSNPGCPFVQRHYQGSMQALQRQAVARGAAWITVNSTHPGHKDFLAPAALAKAYGDWNSAATHLVPDPTGALGRRYEAKTTPHLFVIDAKGVLVYMGAVDDDPRGTLGPRTDHVLPAVAAALAGRLPAITATQAYGCAIKY